MITGRTPRTHVQRRAGRDGYFAPESILRRVAGSPLTPLLGAGPAVLFQVAHPLVAASVVARPDFQDRLWPRWLETVRALYAFAFGTRREADRVAEGVRAVHERVRGTTTGRLGPFPAGTPYSATDPALMLWVHAALVEVALAVYGRFVRRLAPEDERRYYDEMTVVARLVGMPEGLLPATLAGLREYVAGELSGPTVAVTEPAREIAAAVFDAPLPLALRALLPTHRLATAGLIPPELRAQYGLAWSPARAAALGLAATSLRAATVAPMLALERLPLAV